MSSPFNHPSKELFLEYKFGDYDTAALDQLGATGWIVPIEKLTPARMAMLSQRAAVSIACRAFEGFDCPLQAGAQAALRAKLAEAASYNPERIIIDHLRFDGRWEATRNAHIPETHAPRGACVGVNRSEAILRIAEDARRRVPENIVLGYFAVPLMAESVPQLTSTVDSLGQDHTRLGQTLDLVSPMLYHRMIGKSTAYIREYAVRLASVCKAEVMPILQTKDMPDDRQYELNADEMFAARNAALSAPVDTIAWFSLDGAIEKQKLGTLQKL